MTPYQIHELLLNGAAIFGVVYLLWYVFFSWRGEVPTDFEDDNSEIPYEDFFKTK